MNSLSQVGEIAKHLKSKYQALIFMQRQHRKTWPWRGPVKKGVFFNREPCSGCLPYPESSPWWWCCGFSSVGNECGCVRQEALNKYCRYKPKNLTVLLLKSCSCRPCIQATAAKRKPADQKLITGSNYSRTCRTAAHWRLSCNPGDESLCVLEVTTFWMLSNKTMKS